MTALQTLVVDDSLSARTVLKRLLERKGAKVHMIESGSAALKYLRSHRPDVVFMDHTMPGMTGLDAVKVMRKDPATASIPVIMYTSQSDPDYQQLAMDQGASGIIPKPATWTKIANALEKIVPPPYSTEDTEDQLALSINKELSSLRDHLSFNMERQIELLHDELLKEIDESIRRNHTQQESQPAPALSNLIHTITDSKLHKMNLELRQHMTAKLDVLLQDMKDEQRAFQQEIQQQLNQSLPQPDAVGKSASTDTPLQQLLTRLHSSYWSNLPVWIACGILLIALFSWPTG
ncbi:MAG: response regulator [Ketobacter sp.]|nr:response regulator [Ketobacter sp.]